MPQPILFIETPRAGKFNHRFIVANGYTGGDTLLSKWASIARGHTEGWGFIAAFHEVTQPTTGRRAIEQLILAGINTDRLAGDQLTNIHTILSDRLTEVERLVMSVEWEQVGGIHHKLSALDDWYSDIPNNSKLPQQVWSEKSTENQHVSTTDLSKWWLIATGSLIAVMLLFVVYSKSVVFNQKYTTVTTSANILTTQLIVSQR
ncbi:hypothetical protein TI04_06255 [Achromatium sp. WMS2]|nr:hypothetical protein TI04_06255 [Achromatium sp. WMS2]